MKLKLILSYCLVILMTSTLAQSGNKAISAHSGHEIVINVGGVTDTSGLVAFHYGDQKLVHDTVDFDHKGRVVLKGEEMLPRGMYLLVTPAQNYFEFIVAEDQHFVLTTSKPNFVEEMKVQGSKVNKLFYKDMRHIISQRKTYERMSKRHQQLKASNPDSAAILKEQMQQIDSDVRSFRKKIKEEHPNTFYAKFLSALEEPEIPEVPVDEETGKADSSYPYRYFRQHYFDGMDFTEEGLVRTPVYHQKMKQYIKELTPQVPDSIIKSADYLLEKASQDSTLFQYTLAWMLNEYAQREIMGMDAVYVHLVEEYYMQDRAPWVSKSQMKKIVGDAMALKPLLIGKQAPDIVGKTPEGKVISLHEFEAPYTILAFWDSDCGHCRKEIPKLYNKWKTELKDMGVRVLAVSVEYTTDRWTKFIKEKELDGWTHIIDTEGVDDYRQKYDIKATPVIYVLDEDKDIIAKWLGVDQIPNFIKNYEKRKQKTDGDPTSFPQGRQ